jgi:hypothetical protein
MEPSNAEYRQFTDRLLDTLSSVIEEIGRWCETGCSCFARWVEKLGLTRHGLPDDRRLSLLDHVIPVPDG